MRRNVSNQNELEFINAINNIEIPNWDLSNINYLEFYWENDTLKLRHSLNNKSTKVKTTGDIKTNAKQAIKRLFKSTKDNINMGGCYWIWTNEPINHYLHTHRTPDRFDGGEVIYNGISDKGLIDRILHHLFGNDKQSWSGIGVDIYTHPAPKSHFKKACSPKGKIPMVKNVLGEFIGIDDLNTINKLNLSESEVGFINRNQFNRTFYFRNGICLTDEKHQGFNYRIYLSPGETETYRNYIESSWRNNYGLPRLCSYIKR